MGRRFPRRGREHWEDGSSLVSPALGPGCLRGEGDPGRCAGPGGSLSWEIDDRGGTEIQVSCFSAREWWVKVPYWSSEETAVRDLFARVDEVLDVAHSIEDERPQEAARLVHVSRGALSSAEPVRVPIAARILLVSDKTVRAWAEDGLLTPRAVRPRLLLDAERLHTVLRLLDDLRAVGQDRDFRDNLWNRLKDEALVDRADLAESLSQMNAGKVRPALTFDEEREERRNRR
jgi:hypothetical protein